MDWSNSHLLDPSNCCSLGDGSRRQRNDATKALCTPVNDRNYVDFLVSVSKPPVFLTQPWPRHLLSFLLIPQLTHTHTHTCNHVRGKNRPGAYMFEFKSAPEDAQAIVDRSAFKTRVQGLKKTQIRHEFNLLINAISAEIYDQSDLEYLMSLDGLLSVTPIVSRGVVERERERERERKEKRAYLVAKPTEACSRPPCFFSFCSKCLLRARSKTPDALNVFLAMLVSDFVCPFLNFFLAFAGDPCSPVDSCGIDARGPTKAYQFRDEKCSCHKRVCIIISSFPLQRRYYR